MYSDMYSITNRDNQFKAADKEIPSGLLPENAKNMCGKKSRDYGCQMNLAPILNLMSKGNIWITEVVLFF